LPNIIGISLNINKEDIHMIFYNDHMKSVPLLY
jgi:hypothetical protein